ncbi:FliH/SctL family protein [uncultured Sphingomonas sp.]|uniref:FliH/SctL family protein n=1 Tax=uncultured Sphingomonas sp. TaxID=158754 RepID=UPI00260C38BF|nr:FliH/SctL family protein [uncultured Sphingomonas sp.]
MSDFIAGFAARHDAAAAALHQAFSPQPAAFAAVDLIEVRSPVGFTPRATPAGPVPEPDFGLHVEPEVAAGPKHFSPADRQANPTAGWDMMDPCVDGVPFIDPVEAAHAAGFAEGMAAASAQAQSQEEALLVGIQAALSGGRVDREALAGQLRQTVLFLVSKLVGEVGIAAERLAGRVEVASEMLADAAESALLRVHPDDVGLLQGRLPDTVFPVGDASVARGSFVLESASTVVEDGPALWLDQLAQAMDRVPVPAC